MTNARKVFILSGGAGTRLWPLSRETFPKQFFDFSGSGMPLMVETAERLRGLGDVTVLTTQAMVPPSRGIFSKNGYPNMRFLGEPQARNTAAAVAWATLTALRENPSSMVGIFPADHLITKTEAFRRAVERAFVEAEQSGLVVTLGICPTEPSTAYGYMELQGSPDFSAYQAQAVSRFIEKPDRSKAETLLASGKVVWNAGMFIFSAQSMARNFETHMPDLWSRLQALKTDESNLKELYASLPSQSIDYGVMEKLGKILCVPLDCGWSDMGSWEEVAKQSRKGGDMIEIASHGNFFTSLSPQPKKAAFVGTDDLVVVDTPDAILVVKKGEGQRLRDVVATIKASVPSLAQNHVFEERPWGRFEVLLDSDHFKSKRITVWPGQRLSYQSHTKRAEHWVVVKGTAEVTLNDELHQLKAGEHIFIPLKAKHRMSNPGNEDLEFIEVQVGTYFGEDDIVRYSDEYGRN